MIQNYLKIALRNLRNHKGYTSINVAGLAIGLTCCLLIALYVRYELSYDRSFDHAEDIYRIAWHSEMPQTRTPHPMAHTMVEDFPEVVAATSLTPLWGPGLTRPAYTIRYQDRQFDEAGVLGVDSTFFEVFSLPVVAGDARAALREPGRILLTASMARKYFGDEDPLGKPLLFNGEVELTVGAVLADVPEATHFHFDFLVSYVSLKAADPGNPYFTWEDFGHYNYIRLAEGTNPAALQRQLPAWSQRYIDFSAETQAAMVAGTRGFRLQQITDIHLHSQIRWELEPNGNIAYVYIFSAAAVLLLLIACINFMNLATARSARRAREVGMRKTLGAVRLQLIAQFLGESLLLSTSAVLLAVALTELLMPFFNNLAGTSLSLWHLDGLTLVAALAGIALFTGLLAGSYPAFFLSSFQPVQVLKGRFRGAGERLRKALVVFQFAASIILIVGTLVVYNQLDFLRNQQLGFDIEQVVVLPIKDDALRTQIEATKNALNANPNVISTATVSNLPGENFNQNPIRWHADDETELMAELRVDFDALQMLDIDLADGRAFSRNFPSDSAGAFILNESAARLFDWPTAVGEQLTWFDDEVERTGEVIGVVKDFHFASLHQEVQPLIIQVLPQEVSYLLVRIRPEQVPATLAFLEDQWTQVQPAHPFEYSFLDQDFNALYQSEERMGALFMSFAGLAVFIACLGLFGLAAFTAEQRTKEIGVRKVMGASVSNIAVLLSSDFVRLVGLAFLLAAPIAYIAAQRWLDSFAYRVDLGAGLFLIAGLLALAIALATVSYHAIRAALADPVQSLRYE